MTGRVIVLNGPSSSGKSTLCKAVQAVLPRPFLFFSFDMFLFGDMLSRTSDGAVREWSEIRPRVEEGFRRSIRSLADAGNDVLVELIVEDQSWLEKLEEALLGLDVFWVGLHAPVQELERRERKRGGRAIGDARRDAEIVHSFRAYDLDLDTTEGVDANVAALVDAWTGR